MESILHETTATHNGTSSAAEEQNLVQYCSALLCLDSYAISFMVIHRTKSTNELQFQTFSPAIPRFRPCKYSLRNKKKSVLGCAAEMQAAHPF